VTFDTPQSLALVRNDGGLYDGMLAACAVAGWETRHASPGLLKWEDLDDLRRQIAGLQAQLSALQGQ
jgi:hypothetical protein